MSNEIIAVKQLPVIVEQLAQIKEQVSQRVAEATSLVCTDETVKAVKKTRAELNAEFKAWEEKRKEVKTAVMTPYEKFESVYKECVSDAYKSADKLLKEKIDSIETELKNTKADEVKSYFNEYLVSCGIDFVTFEQAKINVTLSASLKSLKEQAKAFIDKVYDDLVLIETQEHSAEIFVEYKNTLNVSQAITSVTARHKAVEEEKKRQEEITAMKAAEEKRCAEITAEIPKLSAPELVQQEDEKEYTLRFKVTATKAKLKELKEFLINGGYKYE